MHVKITMRFCESNLIPVRMATTKSTKMTNVGEDVEKRKPSYTVGVNVNHCSHQWLCFQGDLQLLPASPGGSPKLSSCVLPRLFSVLSLGSCGILYTPFKSEVSIFQNTLAFLMVSPSGLQSQIFWVLIFQYRPPGWGAQCGGQTPCFLWRTSAVSLSSHLWVTHPGIWILTIPSLHPPYPSCGVQLQKIFSASLLVFLYKNCSLSIYSFCVPMGGKELMLFLLCHLDHSLGICNFS